MRASITLFTLIAVASINGIAWAQAAASPADGPWSGQVQCVLSARGANYQDDQTHTWRITGGPPVMNGVFRQWPAVWTVTGSGNRRVGGAGGNGGQTENWTTNVPDTRAPIAVWEPSPGSIRFGSQHGLLVANGGLTGHTITPGTDRPFAVALEEWEFPIVDDMSSNTTISGTRTRTLSGRGRGWRQPADVPTIETCTWSYTKGNAAGAPVPPPRAISRGDFPSPIVPTLGGVITAPGGTTVSNPPIVAGAIAGRDRFGTEAPTVPSNPTKSPVGAIAILTEPVSCQMAGPAIQSPVQISPARAYLQWAALPGATGYTVARDDIGPITPAPIQATTFVHNAPFDYRVAYTYTVTAQYKVGCGTSKVTVTAPRPGTPTITSVSAINGSMPTRTGSVRISWELPGSDATGYLVLGPGLPQNGREILAPLQSPTSTLGTTVGFVTTDAAKTATALPFQIEINSLRAGTYTWLIAPFWNTPTGRAIDVNTGARATATVGFYRVLITGVRVDHETVDNPLSLDGRGDEIYVAAAAFLSGELVAIGKSSAYGDDNPVPSAGDLVGIFVPPTGIRIRAGTGSVTGGLRTGDVVPFPDPSVPVGPPSSTMFPFIAWEGWLGGSTEVVVKPTIWEWDGDLTYYNNWSSAMRGWPTTSLAERESIGTTQSALMITPQRTLQLQQLQQMDNEQVTRDEIYRTRLEQIKAKQTGISPSDSQPGYDRAIGGMSGNWLSVHADGLVLHNQLIDMLADGARSGSPAMTAAVNFRDVADLAGRYTMFVLLQQVP